MNDTDLQLAALREDVHKGICEAMSRVDKPLSHDVAEFLIEMGWRHPDIGNCQTPGAAS